MPVTLQTIEELKQLTHTLKPKKYVKNLIPLLEQKQIATAVEFSELIIELINDNYDFVCKECYYKLRDLAARYFSATDAMSLDQIIINAYILKGGERLITSFRGKFSLPKTKLTGHIYLSNFRFFGNGVYEAKGSGAYATSVTMQSIRAAQRKSIAKAIVEELGDQFTEEMMSIFPYNFPIMNAYNIKRGYNKVSYNVSIEYEEKGKLKTKKLHFSVEPKIEKKESLVHSFNERKVKILDAIEETLTKAQSS